MKRASYRHGIEWIALNDDPGSQDAEDVECVSEMIADLFLMWMLKRLLSM